MDKVSITETTIDGKTRTYTCQTKLPWQQLKATMKSRGGKFEDNGNSFTYLSTIGTFRVYTRIEDQFWNRS